MHKFLQPVETIGIDISMTKILALVEILQICIKLTIIDLFKSQQNGDETWLIFSAYEIVRPGTIEQQNGDETWLIFSAYEIVRPGTIEQYFLQNCEICSYFFSDFCYHQTKKYKILKIIKPLSNPIFLGYSIPYH